MRFVCINANRGRSMHWQVQFKVEGRVQHFGMFVDEEVAGKVAAFAKAKLNMGAGVNSIKCVFLFKSFVCVLPVTADAACLRRLIKEANVLGQFN